MTVRELIAALSELPLDLRVGAYDREYNYWYEITQAQVQRGIRTEVLSGWSATKGWRSDESRQEHDERVEFVEVSCWKER